MSPVGKHASLPARTLLVALPLVLPFEAPLCKVGPLTVTSVELVLYGLLAAWALDLLVGWRDARRRLAQVVGDRLGVAVVIWLAAALLSALAAPAFRTAAIKFALRGIGGGLLFFAARDLVRTAGDARRVAVAVAVGATVAAALAVAECTVSGLDRLWTPFRPSSFSALGLTRASGAFAYPTIAAMYLEAALPLTVVAMIAHAGTPKGFPHPPAMSSGGRSPPALARSGARGNWRWMLSLLLASVLVAALLLSSTRTALVGAWLAMAATLLLGWRSGRPLRLAAGGTLVVLALAVASALFAGPDDSRLAQRLRWWRDANWFRVQYTLSERRLVMPAAAVRKVDVTIRNTGALTWPHATRDAVFLSYHWETRDDGKPRLGFEGRRTPLPTDVKPGGQVRLLGVVQAPQRPGNYRLRWDLVRETILWFSSQGNATADQEVTVTPVPKVASARGKRYSEDFLAMTLEESLTPAGLPRLELWRAAMRLWRHHPLLGVGPDNFRHLYLTELPAPRPGMTRFEDENVHANDFYVETLTDMGLLGLGALGLLIFALVAAVRARLAAGPSLLVVAFTVSAGTFFVHGLLDYFLPFTPTYGLYWLVMALAGGVWSAPGASPAPPDSRS